MIARPLSERDRRALRLGLAAVALLLAWALGVRPAWRAARAESRRLDDERALLARELGLLRDTARDAALARSARERLTTETSRLLDRADLLAASASLSAAVRRIAEATDVRLQRTEAVVDGDSADVALELRADGDFASIVSFLRAVERSDRLVRVERLAIDRRVGTVDEDGLLALSATLRARAGAREDRP